MIGVFWWEHTTRRRPGWNCWTRMIPQRGCGWAIMAQIAITASSGSLTLSCSAQTDSVLCPLRLWSYLLANTPSPCRPCTAVHWSVPCPTGRCAAVRDTVPMMTTKPPRDASATTVRDIPLSNLNIFIFLCVSRLHWRGLYPEG